MRIFTFLFFTSSLLGLQSFSAQAQSVVTETDITRQAEKTTPTDNWVAYNRNGGAAQFIQGPGTPPSGCGSLQFSTPTGNDKAFLYNFDFDNTPLASISALSYATYQQTGSAHLVPAINMVIDINGAAVSGGEAVLIFEPVYNTNQSAIAANTWQTWDAFNGGNAIWWSAMQINGVCPFSCYVTWNQIVTSNPQAVILGGFGINQGSGNPGLLAAADALTIGVNGTNTTFDFENIPAATYYADADGDGYGNPANAITACSTPTGYVTDNTDVNDTDPFIQRAVCYQGTTTYIAAADLSTYLGNGATTGPCLHDNAPIQPEAATLEVAPEIAAVSALTYPNPTNGALNIKLAENTDAETEILIMNANGTVIESRKTTTEGQTENFDLSANGPGIYFIKIISGNTVEHSKVLVQ